MHPEHPAGVLARRPGLSPEARREAGVAERQVVGLEDLAHVHPGEGDLRRARQEEVVLLQRVDVRPLGREEARADHRLLAHEHRRQHRHEARLGDVVDREAVEREREQRGVADEVAEPRAGEPRGALELEAADLRASFTSSSVVGSPDTAELDGVVLGVAVGRRVVGGFGTSSERGVALGLAPRRVPPRRPAAPP